MTTDAEVQISFQAWLEASAEYEVARRATDPPSQSYKVVTLRATANSAKRAYESLKAQREDER